MLIERRLWCYATANFKPLGSDNALEVRLMRTEGARDAEAVDDEGDGSLVASSR